MRFRINSASFLAVLFVCVILLFNASLILAEEKGKPNPPVLPPQALAHGKSLGEWAGCYWSWAVGMPFDEFVQAEGIVEGQSGSLFFLPGSNVTGPTIEAELRPGVSLFIPRGMGICWAPDDIEYSWELALSLGLDPETMTDVELLALCAQEIADRFSDRYCVIDGTEVENFEEDYHFETPPFDFYLNEGWWRYEPGLRGPGISIGNALILPPLSPSEHTITCGGNRLGEIVETTYYLTIRPKGKR